MYVWPPKNSKRDKVRSFHQSFTQEGRATVVNVSPYRHHRDLRGACRTPLRESPYPSRCTQSGHSHHLTPDQTGIFLFSVTDRFCPVYNRHFLFRGIFSSFPHVGQITIYIIYTSWFKHKTPNNQMTHAFATRMSHIWYHADRHEQWKRVTQPFFLLRAQDWRQRRKCVPTNHRPSKRSIIDRHLLQE